MPTPDRIGLHLSYSLVESGPLLQAILDRASRDGVHLTTPDIG
jgi:hypothetical protein